MCACWRSLNPSVNAFLNKASNCDSFGFRINFIKFLGRSSRRRFSRRKPFSTKQINFGKTVNLYIKQSLVLISTVARNNGSRKTITEYYFKQSLCDFEGLQSTKDQFQGF